MQMEYTQMARRALELAEKFSREMQHNYIGTEHILVGLLREQTGVAAHVLVGNGMTEEKLLELIRDLIAPGEDVLLLERDGYSPRARRVLEAACQEAEHSEASKIGTEHLLLAILKEPECVASRLLNTMGVSGKKV